MGEIILVRHGQANSGARDEESYDKLSELGHQQAGWLGDYLRDREKPFDKIISGSLRRHKETATGIGYTDPIVDLCVIRRTSRRCFTRGRNTRHAGPMCHIGRGDWHDHSPSSGA